MLAGWLPRRLFAPQAELAPATAPSPSEPIIEVGVIRRLGAETVEFPVRPDDEAVAPRRSSRIRAGDRLHVLVRREEARALEELQERWRHGPIGPPPRPRRRLRGTAPIFTVRPAGPGSVSGEVDEPERALEDGRYAVTAYARRRVERADPDERAWLQSVVGALAIDVFAAAPRRAAEPTARQAAAN